MNIHLAGLWYPSNSNVKEVFKTETIGYNMNLYNAGGGTLGLKNKECEMNFYAAGTDMNTNKDKDYEMNFYAAAIGYNKDGKILEETISKGLRKRLLSYIDRDAVKGAFEFWLNPKLKDKKFFLDSGAYSAFTRGIKIDINEYIKFVHKHKNELTVYANLDVIGDGVKSEQNLQYIESHGLHPLPVYTASAPISELSRLCEKYNYIALGGLVGGGGVVLKHLDRCFSVIKKYFPMKIHLFGITSQKVLERYPVYSCDSSSAIMGGGMGRVMEFKNGKMESCLWRKSETTGKHLNCRDKDGSAHLQRRITNIKAMLKLEKHLTELWKRRSITWD